MTAYSKGRAFEWKVRGKLEEHGFFCLRSAASRGSYDIVAWHNDLKFILAIQCKHRLYKNMAAKFLENAYATTPEYVVPIIATPPPCSAYPFGYWFYGSHHTPIEVRDQIVAKLDFINWDWT